MGPWILYFDGLCEEKNPGGRMAWGWLIERDGMPPDTGKGSKAPTPENTNNQAEYYALGYGLKRVMELVPNNGDYPGLIVRGDSKLVIEQVSDHWAVNAEMLKPLHARCLEMLHWLEQGEKIWGAEWIPREQNTAADALSREAYCDAEGKMPRERQKFSKHQKSA